MTELRWTRTVAAPETTAAARVELAAVCRLVAREGFAPIGAARLAIRDPRNAGAYLANPAGMLLEEVTAASLVPVDRDGRRTDTGSAEPDSGGLALALAALEANPRATAAAQVASTAGTVVASLRDGLLPMTQTSFMFHGGIGRHEWDPSASPDALRRRIAADMGGGTRAALVRGRGLLVAAETAAQTWKLLFFLDKCCRSQVQAMAAAHAAGRPVKIPAQAVVEHAVRQSTAFVEHPRFVADWSSFVEQLDREDRGFRN